MSVTAKASTDTTIAATTGPDYTAIKTKQQGAWATGDYAVVGVTLQIVGETLCEALDLRAGQNVLDVAAGNGNASLAAARRWCNVVSTDYVGEWLDRGRARAEAEGLTLEFQEADAEALPFSDGSFDVVLSTFGVMFTPDQEQSAAELLRVCKPGGKIGLANWTPDSFIGELFKTIGKYVPPPAGVNSPALWGTRDRLTNLFGSEISALDTTEKVFSLRYKSPQHWVDIWREIYGPVNKAFAAQDDNGKTALEADLIALIGRFNKATDGTMVVPSKYLEIVATRRG